MTVIIDSNNEAVSRVPTAGLIPPLLRWLSSSNDLPTQSHSEELRQTNQYAVDADKFMKAVLSEDVLLIQHQGGFYFLHLMYLQSRVIIQNIIL